MSFRFIFVLSLAAALVSACTSKPVDSTSRVPQSSISSNTSIGSVNVDTANFTMTGPDSALVKYSDRCSNGENIDNANRDRFIQEMMKNPQSKLSKMRAKLLKEIKINGESPRGEGVAFTPWTQSFHSRNGCGQSLNSYSTIAVTMTGGNSNYTSSKFLITIDDDDNEGTRSLKIRNIQPIQIRNDE